MLYFFRLYFHQCYSMRILPHHQDTGGFFVAVLKKVKSLPWERETCVLNQSTQNTDGNENKDKHILEEFAEDTKLSESGKRTLEKEKKSREPSKKRRRMTGYREDPFVFFKDQTEDVWQSIK